MNGYCTLQIYFVLQLFGETYRELEMDTVHPLSILFCSCCVKHIGNYELIM